MGLPSEERVQLRQAAELHDIGKLAIPEEVLHKPGPLDPEEWVFVRRHPLVGERIPLGARIIAVCDAVTAMTSPRPYAPQRTVPEAVAELRRGAGGQFDPAVVDAFSELVVELVWPTAPAPSEVSGGGAR